MNTNLAHQYRENFIELVLWNELAPNQNIDSGMDANYISGLLYPHLDELDTSKLHCELTHFTGNSLFANIINLIHPTCSSKQLYAEGNYSRLNYLVAPFEQINNEYKKLIVKNSDDCIIHILASDIYAKPLAFILMRGCLDFPKCYIADKELCDRSVSSFKFSDIKKFIICDVPDWEVAPRKVLEHIKKCDVSKEYEFDFADILK